MTERWTKAGRLLLPAGAVLVIQVVFFPMPIGAVASGALLGLIGALGAVGIALIWKANRVVNFAQGDLGVFPATLAVLLVTLSGLPWLLSVGIGLATAIAVGLAVDLLVIRRFFRSPRLILTVATIGLSQILGFCALILPRAWGEGPEIRTLTPPFEFSAQIGGVFFDGNDLIAVIVAPIVLIVVMLLLTKTETGLALRASAERSDRASMLGIPVRRLETEVWVVATVMSFVSVTLTAGVGGLPFGLGVGLAVLLRALAALVLGRMTNFGAITLAAVAIGILESGVRWNTGGDYLMPPILAALIIVALLVQKRGTTRADRDESSSWASLCEVRPVPAAVAELREVRIVRFGVGALAVAAVLFLPLLFGTNGQLKAGVVVVFAMIGASVVVLSGWAGQVSLGQMAFVGVGAGIGAATMGRWGWDPLVSMLVAGPAGAVVAVVVGLPALRLKGLYLAVTTLALSVAASAWIFSNRIVDWIPDGTFARPPVLGTIDVDTPMRLYYFTLIVAALMMWILRGIRRSRTGRVLVALRDNEVGTTAFGVNTTRAKLTAFAVSGWVAATAGAVLVFHQAAFRDVTYLAEESVAVFVATVVGGLGSLSGGVIGAIFARGVAWLLPAPWSFLVVGIGVLVALLVLPAGLGGLLFSLRDRYLASAARRNGVVVLSLDRSSSDLAANVAPESSATATATADAEPAPATGVTRNGSEARAPSNGTAPETLDGIEVSRTRGNAGDDEERVP